MSGPFYVDWEGRGYDKAAMEADIALMRTSLGDGPVYAGGNGCLGGHFFSSGPSLDVPSLTAVRGGRELDAAPFAKSAEDDPPALEEFPSWEGLAESLLWLFSIP